MSCTIWIDFIRIGPTQHNKFGSQQNNIAVPLRSFFNVTFLTFISTVICRLGYIDLLFKSCVTFLDLFLKSHLIFSQVKKALKGQKMKKGKMHDLSMVRADLMMRQYVCQAMFMSCDFEINLLLLLWILEHLKSRWDLSDEGWSWFQKWSSDSFLKFFRS